MEGVVQVRDLIVAAVTRTRRIEFAKLIAPWQERIHGVMTLLAGLELGRRRVVSLRQTEPFAPLWIYRGPNAGVGGGDNEVTGASGAEPGPADPAHQGALP